MRIIARKSLREFWKRHAGSEQALKIWFAEVKNADWKTPADLKKYYNSVSFLSDNRVVFNIKGNTYRLIAAINYKFAIVYIRFIGTHKQYDKVDALTI